MWAIDLTHTSHTRARTGIQKVCLTLLKELGQDGRLRPLVHDRYAGQWRDPDREETNCLRDAGDEVPPGRRSSRWSWRQQLRGRLARFVSRRKNPDGVTGLFCPEIIDSARISSLLEDTWTGSLTKVALFHDAIAVTHPEWCPARTVEHFPNYLVALSRFDHVICISESSRQDLLQFWQSKGITPAPNSVVSLGLAGKPAVESPERESPGPGKEPVILMVGTLEARKNHLALLQACGELWAQGLRFELKLAGMLNRETGTKAAQLVESLRKEGRPVQWLGPVSDDELASLYKSADIFTYPSLYEGFGLPVLEALAHGLPVLTTNGGALGELSGGGGCRTCDGSVEGIRMELRALVEDPDLRSRLALEARQRQIRSMRQCAEEIGSLLQELGDRPRS
jgi:glycosyltransferase involved in cell wall biosynthesis